MLAEEQLRDILARPDLDRTDMLLACLAVDAKTPKEVKAVMALAESHGLRSIRKWNVSSHLSRSKGLASRVTDGWVLTAAGRKRIVYSGLAGAALLHAPLRPSENTQLYSGIRIHATLSMRRLPALKHSYTERPLFSAGVGAVSLLYDHVVAKCLSAFNAEAARRKSEVSPCQDTR